MNSKGKAKQRPSILWSVPKAEQFQLDLNIPGAVASLVETLSSLQSHSLYECMTKVLTTCGQRISRVEFRSELPKGSLGKILKKELRRPYWEGPASPGKTTAT